MTLERRPLGRTGLSVSSLCLGTMTFGEQNMEAQAHAQLDRARDAGVNFIDTAEMYPVPPRAETQGRTEAFIGTWWAGRPALRERFVLATKVVGPGDFPYLRGGPRLDRAHVHAACEASLKRLQTDVIDLYQVHWPARATNFFGKLGYAVAPDPDPTPIAETLAALDELVRAGKVRHVGVSNETPWGVAEWLRLSAAGAGPRIASVQNPYNLLNRSFEVGLAEFAHREDVGLLAYSPLAFGALSGKYLDGARPPEGRLTRFARFQRYNGEVAEAAIAEYAALARAHGLSPAGMALAFVTSRPFVTSNIIGATTLEQLDENLRDGVMDLPQAVRDGIEDIHRRRSNPCP